MIAAIETAIEARLKAAETDGTLGYAWRELGSYSGELDAERLGKIAEAAPAAWVVWGGDTVTRRAGGRAQLRSTWVVVVAARSMRDEATSRHGAGADVGAYRLAEDVARLIDGQRLGLDLVQPMTLTGRRQLRAGATRGQFAAVYAVLFDCSYRQPVREEALQDFASVGGPIHAPGAPDGAAAPVDFDADPREESE